MTEIQLKRGLKANLPVLAVGEPAYCTDSNELWIGTSSGNKLVNPADWNTILNKPNIPAAYTLPAATASTLGGVKQGTGVTIAGDGTISASGGGTGTVKSVNTISPDANGNVTVPMPSAAPKGVYSSLSALQTAFPTGDSNVYLVVGNDGTKEVETLTVTGAPSVAGNVTVTLNGVSKNVTGIQLGTAEVVTLTITGIPSTAGNVTVTLNGTGTTVALDPAIQTTTALVASAINSTTFTGWTTSVNNNVVTFTATTVGNKTNATWSAGTTGTVATISSVDGTAADDATAVATKIRSTSFTGWQTGGSGTSVTFTSTVPGTQGGPVFSGGTTGVTGSFQVTIPGIPARTSDWYYWNGTAWTDGGLYQNLGTLNDGVVSSTQTWSSSQIQSKMGNISITNGVANGNFANGVANWSGWAATISATNGVLTGTSNGTQSQPNISQNSNISVIAGHKVYITMQIQAVGGSPSQLNMTSENTGTGTLLWGQIANPVVGTWYTLSELVTLDTSYFNNGTHGPLVIGTSVKYADANSGLNQQWQMKNVLAVDLTAAYGAGNEPNKVDFENILNNQLSGWFDGTVNVYNANLTNKVTKNQGGMIQATNLISNGNWSNGTFTGTTSTAWGGVGGNIAVSNNVLTITGANSYAYLGIYTTLPNWTPTDVVCIAAKVKVSDNTNLHDFKTRIFGNAPAVESNSFIYSPIANQEYLLVGAAPLLNLPAGSNATVGIYADFNTPADTTGKVFSIREVQVFNLTQVFGSGYEPDPEAMADILKDTPWFGGTGYINAVKGLVSDVSSLQLRPRGTAYIKVDKTNQRIEASSTANANWTGWNTAPGVGSWNTPPFDVVSQSSGSNMDNFGLDLTKAMPPHRFSGGIRTDQFLSVLSGPKGRWFNGYGAHVFEGWNWRRTFRLTMAIGLNGTQGYEDIANIFSYGPTNNITPGSSGGNSAQWGRLQVGSDELDANGNPWGTIFTNRTVTFNVNSIALQYLQTPSTSSDVGVQGQIKWDANFIYVCTATNTWKRVALTTF